VLCYDGLSVLTAAFNVAFQQWDWSIMTETTDNKPPQYAADKPGICAARIHQKLDNRFYQTVSAATFSMTKLRYRNDDAAGSIGLGQLDDAAWLSHFGNFEPFAGSFESPLALCYHGHQFGQYNPDLGDGRGFLFAQFYDNRNRLMDLGTKGSGTTPFSRSGDGRLTLKGAVREILATEMLEALGVKTSRTLSVIETGESLQRQDEPSPTRSAVLVRLSHSHIRIGSFQQLFYHDDADGIETLARHVARHYYATPEYSAVVDADAGLEDLLADLLQAIASRIAVTAGQWMAAGFVHGVLNTDNFNVTGESFDYGPWRFLPQFDAGLTAAYFDQTRRYAYGRQPEAAMWAVCRLADCFVKLVPKNILEDRLEGFYQQLERALASAVQYRLGITFADVDDERDAVLARQLFTAAKTSAYGFDQIFHDLYGGTPRAAGYHGDDWQPLFETLSAASLIRPDALQHPHFKQSRAVSLTIDEVESVWAPIMAHDDWQPLVEKIAAMRSMRAALSGETVTDMPKIISGALPSA
jgi:uncharacterized protein YdiU (UPF0061 family)